MTPSAYLSDYLRAHHRGRGRAISRADLRIHLQSIGIYLSDRDLRELYAELPVCTCEHGVFWPETSAELYEYREYLKAKAIPLFERWSRVAQAHPDLIDPRQGDLFHDQA